MASLLESKDGWTVGEPDITGKNNRLFSKSKSLGLVKTGWSSGLLPENLLAIVATTYLHSTSPYIAHLDFVLLAPKVLVPLFLL